MCNDDGEKKHDVNQRLLQKEKKKALAEAEYGEVRENRDQ